MHQLNVVHAGGVGDGIMFSPIVKDYAAKYDRISLITGSYLCKDIFKLIYDNTNNIQYNRISNAPSIELSFRDGISHKHWRELSWKRDLDLENKIYQDVINKHGNDYGIIHERLTDNCGRKLIPISKKYLCDNLPYINLDSSCIIASGFRPYNILHYGKLINNAKEVHFYEGSFMNFTDAIYAGYGQLNAHLYCKPHLFDKNMIHHTIIKYIKEKKWHKNNWIYKYEN
jgi:hypothetical protein